ncbi:MAG: ATP-dependent DNA helicase, partial [Planctomycetota bacterium]
LPVLTWAVRTHTGDLGENNALQQFGPWSLFDKLTTMGDECMGKRCSAFGQCFLQAARARSLRADVVVANHALVFAELGLETPVLPDYEEIVFDEAQHVEDVATEHLAVRASRIGVMRILLRLFRSRRGGAGTGLLATAFEYLSAAEEKLERDFVAPAHEAISRAAEEVRPVSDSADDFFADVAELLAPGGYGGGGSGRASRERRRRYRKVGRESERWEQVFDSGRALEKKLVGLADLVRRVVDVMGDPRAKGIRARRELARDLGARSQNLEEAAHNVGFALAAEADNYVYWIEEDASRSRRGTFASLCAAPVQVAELLRAQLLDQKRSVICTSATLTVAGSFDFLSGRLGFDLASGSGRADALEVGSPFDYETQARAFVPRFLPDPRSGSAYVEGLSDLLIDLFAASGGRGMALFTSYAMLDDVRDAVAPALGSHGVRVLAQGKDGSREAMLATLKSAPGTVLLGTSSFWEGVDVPGEALSVLVVARLPFHVFTEPIIEARCEALRAAGEDAFLAYTLPAAVLRLRQGTGRLIRTKSDRGVVVIADPRIVRTGYGRAFVESLPVRARVSPTSKALVREAEAFLNA